MAFAIRSAKEPLGGGFEDTALGFGVADVAALGCDFVDIGFGRGFDVVDAGDGLDGLDAVGLLGNWLPGLARGCSCSSAFRFVPVLGFSRLGTGPIPGFRGSGLVVEEVIDGSGC